MVRHLLCSVAGIALCCAAQAAEAHSTPSDAEAAQPAAVASQPDDATAQPDAAAAQPAASNEATQAVGVADIVVTATRRSVSLQRVPAVIEAVPETTLRAYNITGVLQLPNLVAGLVIAPAGGNNLYLRGIGSASTGFNEAQVANYIDGLYLANPTVGIYSFNNVEQIEVLKGPQGTLYGRNVTGGLISTRTRDPGSEARVDASVGYSNYDTLTTNFYGSVPLGDTLAVNIAGFHQRQSDGWSRNLFNGHEDQRSNETGIETKLQWRPAAGTRITGTFIYDQNNRDLGYSYEVYPGTLGTDGTPYYGRYLHSSRIDANAPTKIYIGMARVEQDLGFARLMSITGYQTSHANVLFASGAPITGNLSAGQGVTYTQFYEWNRTWSQEFQLTSAPSSSRFDWVAGAFYYNDHTLLQLDSYNLCIGTVCSAGAAPTRNTGRPNTLSYSGYGDVGFRLFDSTKLTAGLRYTDETKTLSGLLTPLAGRPNSVTTLPAAATATTAGTVFFPGQPFPGFPNGIPTELHFTKLTYRFVLQQDIGANIHLYASHNLGFKSGAFNGNGFNNPPARPELLYATEAGIRSELFDRRVRLNLTYFHYAYKDVQVRSAAPPALPGTTILQNAASAHADGIDGDLTIAVAPGLTLNGSFEYLNARFVDFPGTTCLTPGTRTVAGVLVGTATSVPCNLAGYRLPQAPPFTAAIGVTYSLDTGIGNFTFSGNYHYNSRYPMIADASVYQPRHSILDASVRWTSSDSRFDVILFVRNLTNAYVYAVTSVTTNFAIVPGAPRTYGITAGVHFQ